MQWGREGKSVDREIGNHLKWEMKLVSEKIVATGMPTFALRESGFYTYTNDCVWLTRNWAKSPKAERQTNNDRLVVGRNNRGENGINRQLSTEARKLLNAPLSLNLSLSFFFSSISLIASKEESYKDYRRKDVQSTLFCLDYCSSGKKKKEQNKKWLYRNHGPLFPAIRDNLGSTAWIRLYFVLTKGKGILNL